VGAENAVRAVRRCGVLLLDVAESIMLRMLSWDRAAIVVASAEAIVGADN
jgi:hypothetical protein